MELTYLGSVKLPDANTDRYSWAFAGGPLAYDSATNRVFMQGHGNYPDIGEFVLPDVGQTAPRATWRDWTNGEFDKLKLVYSTIKHRAICWADGGLFGNVQPYYNVANTWTPSHWHSDGTVFSGFGKLNLRPLQWAGHLGVLPKAIQEKTGFDSWMFDSVSQGIADTNQGPALALFNRSKSVPAEVAIHPLFDSYKTNAYPGWGGDRQINGLTFTQTHAVYTYRKSFGARWYGEGSRGLLHGETGTPADRHDIQSQLYPGRLAVDPYQPTGAGYKAEQYRLHLLCASIDSILAGHPEWKEIDISSHMVRSLRGQGNVVFDDVRNRLIVSEWSADGAKPRLHVFQVEEEDMTKIAELQAALDATNAALAAVRLEVEDQDKQIAALTADNAAKDDELTDKRTVITSLCGAIDAAYNQRMQVRA